MIEEGVKDLPCGAIGDAGEATIVFAWNIENSPETSEDLGLSGKSGLSGSRSGRYGTRKPLKSNDSSWQSNGSDPKAHDGCLATVNQSSLGKYLGGAEGISAEENLEEPVLGVEEKAEP
jgi:hypothetical protein